MLSTILAVVAVVTAAVYIHVKRRFDYWRKRKVPHMKPTSIFGNYKDLLFLKTHPADILLNFYKKFQNEPYFGVYYGMDPAIIVKDPELIKLITTKDFYYFHGRELSDYIHAEEFTSNLFSSAGDYWKVVRQNLTPVFTSAKMRNMFPLIEKCSHAFEKLLDVETLKELNIRMLSIRFTIACIGSCGFGINSETLQENCEDNPFIKFTNFFLSGSKLVAVCGYFRSMFPNLFYKTGFTVTPAGSVAMFRKLIASVYEARNNKPTSRNDFIDYILHFKENTHITGDSISNLKTGDNQKVQFPVTESLMTMQSMMFFLGGFETSSNTLSFTMYELAKSPEAQKKVQEEVDAYLHKYGNKLTYDVVNELPYTWACVEESMRLYPVLVYLTREAMEQYTLPTGLTLEKGMRVHIPVHAIHRDPKFFPDPDVYRPERFIGDERRNIVPYSYMPFGEGLRFCLGMRFAKMQMLSGIVTMMKKYTIELTEQTPRTPVLEPLFFIPAPKTPITFKTSLRPGWETRQYSE